MGEFKVIKGRKYKVSNAEFVVKISNRFDVLMKDEETKSDQDTIHSSKITDGYSKQSSSSSEVTKSKESTYGGFDESTTKGGTRDSNRKKQHSSCRSSKFLNQIYDQQSTAQGQSMSNDNSSVQSSTSADYVRITKSNDVFSDQDLSEAEEGYKVVVRKLHKQKYYSRIFKFKKVKMIHEDNLEQFETANPFECLNSINEDSLETVLDINMKSVPKKQLKKCRYCNYKKRSCDASSSSCIARIKICFKCGKRGHYPQSMCCRSSKTSQKAKVDINQDIRKHTEFSKELLDMIKHKIRLIELDRMDFIRETEQNLVKSTRKGIPLNLIPFLTLYVLMNHDCFINPKLQKGQKTTMKRMRNAEEMILKTANNCANKFIKPEMQIRKQDFLNYCIKKASKLNRTEQVPDREERASLQTILDVFDKVFYKKEESSKRYDSDDSEQLMDNGFIPRCDGEVDLSFDSDESDRSIDKFVIPQFDGGNDSESSQEEKIIEKSFSL